MTTGEVHTDAIAATALACQTNTAVLLVNEKDVQQAAKFINKQGYSKMRIFGGQARGIETFIQTDYYTTLPANVTSQPESYQLARRIHPEVIRAIGLYDRGIRGQNLHVNRETTMPSILIEYGFMDNQKEMNLLKLESYQRSVAEGTKAGIDKYFGF